MTICEVCGKETRRRIRTSYGRICWFCNWFINHPLEASKEYEQLHQLNLSLKKQIYDMQPHFNDPFSAIPPRDILVKAQIALEINGYYDAFSAVLSKHYRIPQIEYKHEPNRVPKGSIACYHNGENRVSSKEPLILRTAFHEFYHALMDNGIAKTPYSDREKHADQYADGCMKMLEKK